MEQWTNFWRQGFITTFGASKPNNYTGIVHSFWKEKFAELPQGSRVLDIACGNGAICTLAAEANRDNGKEFFIAASDLAVINDDLVGDSSDQALRSSIEFHSRTPCESQPFDDDSFDFVTSQFGFEYSDIKKTLTELRRIIRPDGRFVAIAHNSDSVLIKAAREEVDIYKLAIDELDLLGTANRYFQGLGTLAGSNEEVQKTLAENQPLAKDLSDRINKLQEAWPKHSCSLFIIGTINYLARSARQATPEQRLAAMQRATSDFTFARARLNDMAEAALDEEEIDAFTLDAKTAGFPSTHCLKLYGDDEGLAGWQIHLR